jgi:hypothetical protein
MLPVPVSDLMARQESRSAARKPARSISSSASFSIFRPFVTTKLNGTGLGLAICVTIIQRTWGSTYCVVGRQKRGIVPNRSAG